MTSMAVWDFSQAHNLNTILTANSYSFRGFLEKLYGEESLVSSEINSLFGQAKKLFQINSIQEAFDYLESRISDELAALFPLITSNLYLSQEQVNEIKSTLDKNLNNIYPTSNNNGLNECVALYLQGLFDLNFDQSFEYNYKGIFNICGSAVPILKGKIYLYEHTNFQDELDYKDRVLFAIICYEAIADFKASAINANIFRNGFHSELGNILCHNTDLLGIHDGRYYNYMRIMLDHRATNIQSRHICETTVHNLFYTLNTKTLEQAVKEDLSLDVAVEFNNRFSLLIEALLITKLSLSATGVDNYTPISQQYLNRLFKDFLYIQSLMPKYLSEIQITALRRHYIDAVYMILRNTLHAVIYRGITLDSIELENYSIAKHVGGMINEEYGEENKYVHLLYCMNELSQAVDNPTKLTTLNDHFYWFNIPQINKNKSAFNAYEKASKAGSISAKMGLSLSYYTNNQNTAVNKGKSANIELEMMKLNAPLLAFGVSIDMDFVLSGKSELPGITKDLVTDYIIQKLEKFDFSRPDMLLLHRKAYKEKIMHSMVEQQVDFSDEDALDDISKKQSATYLQDFINKHPFVKNMMLLFFQATEVTAIWSIAAQSDCLYSASYLFDDSNIQDISVFPFEFSDLINPDLNGYLLNPANWNLYGFNTENLTYLKDTIGSAVADKFYTACEDALETFTEYEAHIGEIIKSGKLPTIEQVGIFINLYICTMHLTKSLVKLPYTGNKTTHKKLTETFHKFWIEHSAMDWTTTGHTRLSDLFHSRTSNHMISRLINQFAEIRKRPELENILTSPSLAIKWSDSISEFLPNYDSPLGITFALYMQWCTKTFEAACKLDNHLDSNSTRFWVHWLYAQMYLHSSCYYDVEQQIQQKNMSRGEIQQKVLGMNQHKNFVLTLRRFMKNAIPLDECVIQFKRFLKRGSICAAEVYHAIRNGEMSGQQEFLPRNTSLMLRAATSLAQTESMQTISPTNRSVIAPYMMLILLMRHNENDALETREYLLSRLVEYKDAMALVFNVYYAYHNENKVSCTGHTLQEAVVLVREHAVAHRSTIQLLGMNIDDLTIKFPQSKMKFKVSEITPQQWLDAFGQSVEYFKI